MSEKIEESRQLDAFIGLTVLGKLFKHEKGMFANPYFECKYCGHPIERGIKDSIYITGICYPKVPLYTSSKTEAFNLLEFLNRNCICCEIIYTRNLGYAVNYVEETRKIESPFYFDMPLAVCDTAMQIAQVKEFWEEKKQEEKAIKELLNLLKYKEG